MKKKIKNAGFSFAVILLLHKVERRGRMLELLLRVEEICQDEKGWRALGSLCSKSTACGQNI